MTYRVNRLADAWRLVRGTFVPSWADPYIQQNPRALFSRDELFHWQSIDLIKPDDTFDGYLPFRSVEPLLMQHLPAAAGRRAFSHLMESREQRLQEVSGLLERYGLAVSASEECWNAIAKFVCDHVSPSAETQSVLAANPPKHPNDWLKLRGERFVAPVWQSVIVDLSLLMGMHAKSARPSMGWWFWADSGVDEPEAYGRSPWLWDGRLSDERPRRTLLFDLVSVNVSNALEASLKGDDKVKEVVPFGYLYRSLVGDETRSA